MTQTRNLADVLFGGLLVGATAVFIALPGCCMSRYMEAGPGAGAQVVHPVAAVSAPALAAVADCDGADGTAVDPARPRVNVRAMRNVSPNSVLAAWRSTDGVSNARFLERAGRLACPSTAPPHASI